MDVIGGLKTFLPRGYQKKELGYPGWTWSFWGSQFSPYGDNDEKYIQAYQKLSFVYSVINWIVRKSSTVPLVTYTIKDERKYQIYKSQLQNATTGMGIARAMLTKQRALEEIENSEIERLFKNPNPMFTGTELFEQWDGYQLITGDGFVYMASPVTGLNASKPQELWVIPSPAVEIIPNNEIRTSNLIKEYQISYYGTPLRPDQVIHTKYFNPSCNELILRGMSPLMSLRTVLSTYEKSDIAQGKLFANMAPAGIISSDKEQITDQQASSMGDQFRAKHTGEFNAGRIVVTPANVRWQQIGLSAVDIRLLEGKNDIRTDIANVYGVPPQVFGLGETTYNNVSEAKKSGITDAVIPLVNRRVNALNNYLVPKFGNNIVIQPDYSVFEELQDDLNKLTEWLSDSYEISPNEKRVAKGYDEDPDPNMNKKYFPANLMPIDQINGHEEPINIDLLNENGANDFQG